MGPSKNDPTRTVGVFRPEKMAEVAALRSSEMEKFRWIVGEWNYENSVPATPLSPAYTDAGSCRYAFCEKDSWICLVAPDGKEIRTITFDPFSGRWMFVLTQGSYGILRSAEGWVGNCISFTGDMTMLGVDCPWRMTWTKENDNAFRFVNEEMTANGEWAYIDEWRLHRKS